MRYLPHTKEDIHAMLDEAGSDNIEDLFSSIPEELQVKGLINLPPPMDEASLLEHLESLGAKTAGRPFLGAGSYPHHVPPLIGQLLQRGELLTAYTPYQPECSQGTLQLIFEFQSMIAALTGMDVANASMYDGAHAAVEAAELALRVKRKSKKVLVSKALHPEYRRVIGTYLIHRNIIVEEIPFDGSGAINTELLKNSVDGAACIIAGYPNFFGVIEPVEKISEIAKAAGALSISVTGEAVALGLLSPPGALGADIAVGEIGSFGNPMNFGGPSAGFFAAREKFVRQLPGRLAGVTVDREGRRGFVLTLSTREQHIRREKATSNICTNQGLCAAAATIHLSLLGRNGLRKLAKINRSRAQYLKRLLEEYGLRITFSGPTFNEFAILTNPRQAIERIYNANLEGGLDLSRFYDCDPARQSLLVTVTEVHSPEQIDLFAKAVAGKAG